MAAVRPQHTRTQACTRRHLSGIGCPVNMTMKGRKGGEEGNEVEEGGGGGEDGGGPNNTDALQRENRGEKSVLLRGERCQGGTKKTKKKKGEKTR